MLRTVRSLYGVIAVLALSSMPAMPALAQTVSYNYGFCLGVAGLPPANYVTGAFVRSAPSVDINALFRHDLGEKHGGNVRIDATGCRMFPAAEAASTALRQLHEQSKGMKSPFVVIDWVPTGAKALPQPAPTPVAKPAKPAP